MNVDTISNMIIATAISSLLAAITSGNFSLWNIFYKIMNFFRKKDKITGNITVYATKTIGFNGHRFIFPNVYRAIIYRLIQKKMKIESMTKSNDNWSDNSYNIYVNGEKSLKIEDDIFISFRETFEQGGKGDNSNNLYSLIMDVHSYKYTAIELNDIIKEWLQIYEKETMIYVDDGMIYYFSLGDVSAKIVLDSKEKEKKDSDVSSSMWKRNILTSHKTFDNTFFTDKQILLKKLNYFLSNEESYKRRGIPYNIGLLLHGEPGCGKTSCIKAISNLTKRHVVEVNLRKIKTCGDFERIFNDNEMNGRYIPHDKKIIVLEDIDCMMNIIKSRKTEIDKKDDLSAEYEDLGNTENSFMKMMLLQAKMSESTKLYESSDKLTLSCILNTIDGVLESYGRILIITTNFVNRIDDALIRPGRIDMKINFTKCTNELCREIIEHFYEEKLDENITFPDDKYSPAEILELCQLNYEDKTIVIQKIAI